jgi:hypothetical protein
MPLQLLSWDCSACALDWVLRATGLDPESTPNKGTAEIGYPQNINSTYGLMDGSGLQIRRVLRDYGQDTLQSWLDFDSVYNLALQTTGQMSGGAWYHWVGIRGVAGPNLWIANSAPGYKGIYNTLSRADFNRLGGFSVVWLVTRNA